MAGGGLPTLAAWEKEFEAKITPTGGLTFGHDVFTMFDHDVGVSGCVTSMDDFLKKFFPPVCEKTQDQGLNSNYCKYDDQGFSYSHLPWPNRNFLCFIHSKKAGSMS